MKRTVRNVAAISALGLGAALVAAAPASAISRESCNGSDYWVITNYSAEQQVCFAYAGAENVAIYSVDDTNSGNNTGFETLAGIGDVNFPSKNMGIDLYAEFGGATTVTYIDIY
jgi:hypothetical protein